MTLRLKRTYCDCGSICVGHWDFSNTTWYRALFCHKVEEIDFRVCPDHGDIAPTKYRTIWYEKVESMILKEKLHVGFQPWMVPTHSIAYQRTDGLNSDGPTFCSSHQQLNWQFHLSLSYRLLPKTDRSFCPIDLVLKIDLATSCLMLIHSWCYLGISTDRIFQHLAIPFAKLRAVFDEKSWRRCFRIHIVCHSWQISLWKTTQ